MYKELQDKKQNALLLSLREQQDLYMAAANKKGVLKLQRAFKDLKRHHPLLCLCLIGCLQA
jgi:KDO2-lipid IV(A) lauroyltransferase